MNLRRYGAGALAAAALLLLSGCSYLGITGIGRSKECPMADILANTATMTVFRPGMEGDPAGVLYTVSLNGVNTDCSFAKREKKTDSTLILYFRATRAPTGAAASYTVPYYVAVTRGEHILSKHEFMVQFTFAPGAAVARFKDHVGSTKIDLEKGQRPIDYEILAGLQLSKSQRAYDKKMGYYGQ